MHYKALQKIDRQQIRNTLNSRGYYLLTGSGISADSEGKRGPMLLAGDLRMNLCNLVGIPNTFTLQQAYSLLEPAQITSEITDPYTCRSPGKTVSRLTTIPWKRVYTFNVDNTFEEAFKRHVSGDDASLLEVKNWFHDFSDITPVTHGSIVHLHGFVEDPDERYIFSHTEYAKNMARANSWMLTLVQLIRTDPFIICGTTLEEIDVSYYLEHRNEATTRNDVAPSILIEPYPTKLTERLCQRHELKLFHGTTLEFFDSLENEFGKSPSFWKISQPSTLTYISMTDQQRLAFASTFEKVPKSINPTDNAAAFLLGKPLEWGDLAAGADLDREVTTSLTIEIQSHALNPDSRVFLLLDEIGSGKSSLIKRLAYQISSQELNVFYFTGDELIAEDDAAKIFDKITGPCYVFVDNWADASAYILGIVANVARSDIIFVGAERKYRRHYIEIGLADENVGIVESQLDISLAEARKLIAKFEREGISALTHNNKRELNRRAQELANDTIAIACSRIQENFMRFDQIVKKLVSECSEGELEVYAMASLARYCLARGIGVSILANAANGRNINSQFDEYHKLPLTYSDNARRFVIPARSAISERIILILQRKSPLVLKDALVKLAIALAPHVNRSEIKKRAPSAKLSGALMDFDRIIKRFINEFAESFYDEIEDAWRWNSRYWEQRALMTYDRYLIDLNPIILQKALQHARFAYNIERHPLSLTTLAKILFAEMEKDGADLESIFQEAWVHISEAIRIESNWTNIKATAFVVCFNGVVSYIRLGGLLTGQQTEELRDIISITHRRNLREPHFIKLRDSVISAAL